MKNRMFLTGAALLALSGAAIAQTTDPAPTAGPEQQNPPATDPATQPDAAATPAPETSAPADTGTAAPTTATEGATSSATTTDAAASASAGTTNASAAVQADWAKYDKENAGYLTPLQFGTWILASRGQDMTAQVEKSRTGKSANLPAVKVLNATAAEFTKADADHDNKVTPAELTTYLGA